MKTKTCCFTGHREILEEDRVTIRDSVREEIISLIEKGVRYFGAGGARGFDTIAAETVLELKSLYPHIKLILILPCNNQTRGWKEEDIEKYNRIRERADKIKILSQEYYNGCMHARNRHMVDHSAYCICYCRKSGGGAAYTVEYAKEKNINIIYI